MASSGGIVMELSPPTQGRPASRLPSAGTMWGQNAAYKKSVLQETISAVRPQTWEAINRALLDDARRQKVEAMASAQTSDELRAWWARDRRAPPVRQVEPSAPTAENEPHRQQHANEAAMARVR